MPSVLTLEAGLAARGIERLSPGNVKDAHLVHPPVVVSGEPSRPSLISALVSDAPSSQPAIVPGVKLEPFV